MHGAVDVGADQVEDLIEILVEKRSAESNAGVVVPFPNVASPIEGSTTLTAAQAGVYVPTPDAETFARLLGELLDNPEKRAEMALFGRDKFVRELAWHDQAAKYVEVYDALRDARRA